MVLGDTAIKRLNLSRYLYFIAVDNARLNREVASFACINLVQDAVEMFLVAAADHLNLKLPARTDFPQYLDKINDVISPNELPFRRRLIELNKVSVVAKHDGVRPDSTELAGYVAVARDFFDKACQEIFGVNYWSISLVHLLDEGEVKTFLSAAERCYEQRDYFSVIAEARKAFFVEFEVKYDIAQFIDKSKHEDHGILFGWDSMAPYFAKNREYIEKNVKDPFDYIVLDHSHLDSELMRIGIDNGTFWNIRRLTPAVYRLKDIGWVFKNDPDLEEPDGDHAGYVLENMVNIALRTQAYRKSFRSAKGSSTWVVKLRGHPVKILQRAHPDSKVEKILSDEVPSLNVTYGTPGLVRDSYYWRVVEWLDKDDPSSFIIGYVSDEYVDHS
jgi:hypothetical protein